MSGRLRTKVLEKRRMFMFARKDGHPLVLDVQNVSLIYPHYQVFFKICALKNFSRTQRIY